MSQAHIDRAAKAYRSLLPARDRVKAAEAALAKVLTNAARDGLDARAIDEAAFEAASRDLADRAHSKEKQPPPRGPGLEGTPLAGAVGIDGEM